MKVSIEEINGKQCTVIRKPFDPEWVKEQLGMGNTVVVSFDYYHNYINNWYSLSYITEDGEIVPLRVMNPRKLGGWQVCEDAGCFAGRPDAVITILQALPKNPKPEDVCRLYEYMAEGIDNIWGESGNVTIGGSLLLQHIKAGDELSITNAEVKGERVEIALVG